MVEFLKIKYMETKLCKKCGRELPVSMFYANKAKADGLQSSCKECHLKQCKESYAKRSNKEEKSSLKKVYSKPDLATFTPRELMQELKARGFKWDYMLEPQRKVMYDKI